MSGINPIGTFTLGDPRTNPTTDPLNFIFTNAHQKMSMDLIATKTWSDTTINTTLGADERVNIRPASVTLRLERLVGSTWVGMDDVAQDRLPERIVDGVAVPQDDSVILSNSGGVWAASTSHTWYGLPARYDTGTHYQYRVVEIPVPHGYTAAYTPVSVNDLNSAIVGGVRQVNVAVLNTMQTVTFNVSKVWNGYTGNQFATRGNVDVQLLYRSVNTGAWTVATGVAQRTLTEANNWTTSFTGLPRLNNAGVAYEYSVREISIGGIPISANNPFSYSSNVVASGTEPSGGNQTATVTNTLQTRTNITVNKFWEDNNNQDGRRPETVEVRLIRDMDTAEQIISAPVSLRLTGGTTGNNWTHTFNNLPMYRRDGTTLSTYHVVETSIPHYHPADFVIGGGTSTPGTAGSGTVLTGTWVSGAVGEATVVNITNRYTPQVMNIMATKVWIDQYPQYDTRPKSVRLQLFVTDSAGTTTAVTGVTNPVTVNAETAWNTGTAWSNLPIMHNVGGTSVQATATRGISSVLIYTVVELSGNDPPGPILGYHAPTIVYSGGNSTIAGIRGNIATPSVPHTAIVTNTCDTLSSITVNKVWRDADIDMLSDTYINEFSKTAPVEVELFYRLAGSGEAGWTKRGVTRQLTSENQWTGTFTNLPKQNDAGTAYQYTVREIKIGNVNTSESVFPLSYKSSAGTVDAMTGPVYGITVTNELVTRNDITVKKDWNDRNNQDGIRPETVYVQLIKDMNTAWEIISAPVPLSEGNNWTHPFTNLPRYNAAGGESTYHVMEVPLTVVPSYSPAVYSVGSAGFSYITGTGGAAGQRVSTRVENLESTASETVVIIQNSYTPRTMSLTATKLWADANNQYLARPDEIRLQLYVTINPNGETDRTPVPVADGGLVTVTPSGTPATWTHTWDGLPVMRNTGGGSATALGSSVPLYYSVAELGSNDIIVLGYSPGYSYRTAMSSQGAVGTSGRGVSGSVYDTTNTIHFVDITNTINTVNITVNKEWDDLPANGSNLFERRGDVVVRLYYRSGGTGDFIPAPATTAGGNTRTLTASSTTPWSNVFQNLPRRNAAGVYYQYTVREISIGGISFNDSVTSPVFPFSYSSTSNVTIADDGPGVQAAPITVTNTLQTRNNITVRKEWNDSNNQDGIRPASVQVRLIKDMNTAGEMISIPVTLNAANNWAHTFTNLPRYNDAGGESNYRVMEVPLTVVPSYIPAVYRVGSATEFTGVVGTGAAAGQRVSARVENLANTATATVVTVQNSYTPRVMRLTATKLWNDQNNLYDTRPDSIRLQLFATTNSDGVTGRAAVGSPVIVTPTGSTWTHTWNGLPVMRNTGGSATAPGTSAALFYSVVELDVHGYSAGYVYTPTGSNSAVGSSGGGVRGSISDDTNTTHNVTITNNLNTVNVTVRKQWGDFGDLYRMRPESLTFTLQRRTGTAPFEPVVNSETYPAPVTRVLESSRRDGPTGFLALDTQEFDFTGLPRVDSSGVLWEYRVLETGAGGSGAGIVAPFVPNADPTGGTIGDTRVSHYTFSSSTVPVAGGFRTTVVNEIVMEKIAITGSKTWVDSNNRFGFRPSNLELNVFYFCIAEFYWRQLDKRDYDVQWVRNGNVWSYTIRGQGLTKYEPGTTDLREFAVQEVLPPHLLDFYNISVANPAAAPLPGLPNSSVGERITTTDRNGYIINANFTNSLKTDETTSLWVHKNTDFGPKAPNERAPGFTFSVYFSITALNESNYQTRGTLLTNHDYHVIVGKYAGNESVLNTINRERITGDGKIEIAAGESFVLRDLPQGMYFYIVEDEHIEFALKEGSVMNGRLGRTIITDPPADPPVDLAPTLVEVENEAVRVVSIVNTTPNEGIQNGGTQAPSRRTNAGGTVTVEDGSQMYTEADGVEGVRDALAVRWEPEGFWTVGGHFTIKYIDFGETGEQSITVTDYLNPDGTPKSLEELLDSTDNPEGLRRFIRAGARLHITPGGAVRLVLSHLTEDMPRSVTVEVRFVPTLAVNNITVDEVGVKTGGNVMVIGRDGFDDGNLKICSDGVPALGGTPYVSQSVYGIPEEGFTTDWSHIAVRNLNALDGVYVLLEPCEDGFFTAQLPTVIAGMEEIVEKSGRITRGSVLIEFDGLPVPLQVDLRFIPLEIGDSVIDDDPDVTDDPYVQGGLPQTGVVSMLWILVLGLVTSVVATGAVLIVIRRQSLKEKR
jgi:LPXTG-motif cell wall-anchored protein